MRKVNVISEGDISLQLDSAVLLYRSYRGDVYATVHAVEEDPNNPARRMLGPGIPATKEALASFAQAVSVATAYAGFVPENLLYTSPNALAWWTPAAVRRTWFRCNDKIIGTTAGAAAHPALVFVAVPGDWFVFALKDNARPAPDTKLCHAPHFNVWSGGRICTGNVKLPPAIDATSIAAYEDAFFRSNFTHPNQTGAVKYKGGVKALWRDQLAQPDAATMTRALVHSKETLKSAIERIAAPSRR
jgi:PRTRC genetic system protein B